MPFIRAMSRKKIRKKEKYPPGKKFLRFAKCREKRGQWDRRPLFSGDREDQDGGGKILMIRDF
jgi:hypothetical protein